MDRFAYKVIWNPSWERHLDDRADIVLGRNHADATTRFVAHMTHYERYGGTEDEMHGYIIRVELISNRSVIE